MKKKQNINITIDTEVYLKARLTENLNLSALINGFLVDFFKDENKKTEILAAELEEIKNRKAILEYEIEKNRREKEENERNINIHKEQEKLDIINRIPRGNDFYSKLKREEMLKEHPELKKYVISESKEDEKNEKKKTNV